MGKVFKCPITNREQFIIPSPPLHLILSPKQSCKTLGYCFLSNAMCCVDITISQYPYNMGKLTEYKTHMQLVVEMRSCVSAKIK